MNRDAIKQDFLSALETGRTQKAAAAQSEAEAYAKARTRYAALWAAVKAWDEAIRDRVEGAAVRFLFEKVSRDGTVTGRISASRPGRAALNLNFQISSGQIATTIGINRRVDEVRKLDELITALQKAIVDYYV